MSGLNNLEVRLNYRGGLAKKDRMLQSRLNALRSAIQRSFQSSTIEFSDGRQFKCLINSDEKKLDYDYKMLSIPYNDFLVGSTTHAKANTNIQCGQVVRWVENDTHWLVFMQYLEEEAYFRGEIVECEEEQIEINGIPYYVYVRGVSETIMDWDTKQDISFNRLDNSLKMYITKDENTTNYIERFKQIKFQGKNWEIQTHNNLAGDGIIVIYLEEDFTNKYEEDRVEKEKEEHQEEEVKEYILQPDIIIKGTNDVKPYNSYIYTIENADDGVWSVSDTKKAKILRQAVNKVEIGIVSSKSGEFDLIYTTAANEEIVYHITIQSL